MVIVAIFLGTLLRTAAPYFRKKKLADIGSLELTWIWTGLAAFLSTWVGIVIAIPTDMAYEMQILVAFSAAFGVNSLYNEALKWKAVGDYIRTGDKPS